MALNDNQKEALQIHNHARATQHLQPLQWDEGLARDAHQWAERIAREDKLHHSSGSGQGENLYWASSSGNPLQAAAQAWINERSNYHGQKIPEGNFGSYGHYSQCMWHNTSKLGMALAKASNGSVYVVGRYSPQGNIVGQKPY